MSGRQRKRFHTSEIMSAPAQLCKRPPPGRIVVVGLASPNFVRPVTSSGAPKDRTRKGRPLAFGSGRAYNIGVKLRHAATLVLGISGCGSRIPPGWKFVDWLGPCLIFLVTVPWFRTGRLISSSETIRRRAATTPQIAMLTVSKIARPAPPLRWPERSDQSPPISRAFKV